MNSRSLKMVESARSRMGRSTRSRITGAIELGNVSVQYKGLYCFGEIDEGSAADEPYVIFGMPCPSRPTFRGDDTNLY